MARIFDIFPFFNELDLLEIRLNELAGVSPRAGYERSDQVMNLVREGVEQYTAILRAAGVQPE